MATATTSNNSNHHHHHHHHHHNKYEDDDTANEQKLHRLRISSNNTPNNLTKRPNSTLNSHNHSQNTNNHGHSHRHNHHHHHHHHHHNHNNHQSHHHHHHNEQHNQQTLTSPSEQILTENEKTKSQLTQGRVMTASTPNLVNINRTHTANVNKTNPIRIATSNVNNMNKKLSSISNSNSNSNSKDNSNNNSFNDSISSQTSSKPIKIRDKTFSVTSTNDNNNSPNTLFNLSYSQSPHTYTIVEGVADTTTSDNAFGEETVTKQQLPPTVRLTNRKRISEDDLKNKEMKDKRLKEFDLLNTVGTGTFGRVMVVRNQESKEYYALKIMSIVDVVRLKQIDHVRNEKNILEFTKHPFIVKLFWTHHSEQYLYMLLEYVPGGELFSVLRQYNKFETKMAVFYAAEIVSALEYLHSYHIVYRDLKPENILLDREGHLKLTDFGFAKKVNNKTFTLCGTPEYLAPEIIQAKGHNSTADWWALGILIYEMLSGSPPFYDESTHKVYEKILQGRIDWPRHFDFSAKDIIKKFLTPDPAKRLGSGNLSTNSTSSFIATSTNNLSSNSTLSINSSPNENSGQSQRARNTAGAEEVKRHRWFVSIASWDDIYNLAIKPPYKPKLSHDGDTSNFEKYDTPDLQRAQFATMKDLDLFHEF